ncbi:hypothetical protein ACOMHN_058926 [Nucella lapillus]
MRGAECWTDHCLVRSILKLHIAPNHQKKPKFKRLSFNTDRLKDQNFHDRFVTILDDRLTSHRPLTGSPTQQRAQFSAAYGDRGVTVRSLLEQMVIVGSTRVTMSLKDVAVLCEQ